MLAVFPWWVPVLVILAAFMIPVITSRPGLNQPP